MRPLQSTNSQPSGGPVDACVEMDVLRLLLVDAIIRRLAQQVGRSLDAAPALRGTLPTS